MTWAVDGVEESEVYKNVLRVVDDDDNEDGSPSVEAGRQIVGGQSARGGENLDENEFIQDCGMVVPDMQRQRVLQNPGGGGAAESRNQYSGSSLAAAGDGSGEDAQETGAPSSKYTMATRVYGNPSNNAIGERKSPGSSDLSASNGTPLAYGSTGSALPHQGSSGFVVSTGGTDASPQTGGAGVYTTYSDYGREDGGKQLVSAGQYSQARRMQPGGLESHEAEADNDYQEFMRQQRGNGSYGSGGVYSAPQGPGGDTGGQYNMNDYGDASYGNVPGYSANGGRISRQNMGRQEQQQQGMSHGVYPGVASYGYGQDTAGQNVDPALSGFNNLPIGSQQVQPLTVESIRGRVYEIAKSQHGCRYLQRAFDSNCSFELVTVIMNEIAPHVPELMMDQYANFLVQKLLDCPHVTPELRYEVASIAAPHIADIAVTHHGTFAVQKLIETVASREEMVVVRDALEPHVVRLIMDPHGNHVIQKVLQRYNHPDDQFIYDAVGLDCAKIATNKQGCCVLQRCLEFASPQQRRALITTVLNVALDIVTDPFGNYVLQYILENINDTSVNDTVATIFLPHLKVLAVNKFSSNVIEKVLRYTSQRVRDVYCENLADPQTAGELLADDYGNYVIQTALTTGSTSAADALIRTVRPQMQCIKNAPYAKKLEAKIDALQKRQKYPFEGEASQEERFEQELPATHGGYSSSTGGAGRPQPRHNVSTGYGSDCAPAQHGSGNNQRGADPSFGGGSVGNARYSGQQQSGATVDGPSAFPQPRSLTGDKGAAGDRQQQQQNSTHYGQGEEVPEATGGRYEHRGGYSRSKNPISGGNGSGGNPYTASARQNERYAEQGESVSGSGGQRDFGSDRMVKGRYSGYSTQGGAGGAQRFTGSDRHFVGAHSGMQRGQGGSRKNESLSAVEVRGGEHRIGGGRYSQPKKDDSRGPGRYSDY